MDVAFPSAEVFATILTRSPSPEAAQRFRDFLGSATGKQTFTEMGYGDAATAPAAAAGPMTLMLYCAAGVQKPAEEIVALFKTRHPEVEFEVVYQGSGTLLAQIGLSQAGDLYIAGDEVFMNQAKDKGLILHAERIAVFTPVLAVPKGNPKHVAGFADLAKDGLRLGLGDEKAAAVGGVSRKLLTRLGVWPAAEKNVVVTAGTVDQLAVQTSLGSLDASIIWDATASQFKDRLDVVAQGDAGSRVDVPIGVLKFTQHKDTAEEFVALAASPDAAAILQKHGFQPAAGPGKP
jgi:molybdate transport system substrate-binding protein